MAWTIGERSFARCDGDASARAAARKRAQHLGTRAAHRRREDVGRRRLEGDPAEVPISSPEDWPPAGDASEAAWDSAKAALERGHQSLVDAISRVPESRLDEPILEGKSTVYVTLHGVIQHDLYHAGQIAMLKKAV